MKRLKEKLIGTLGTVGFILYFIISAMITVAPLVVLDFPFWIDAIIIFVVISLPFIGGLIEFIIWIWSFVVIISAPISALSYIYFILFAARFLPNVIDIIMTMLYRR